MRKKTPSNYIINQERMEEMYRLIKQAEFLMKATGGAMPERGNALSGIHALLDLACGPASWLLEVANLFPEVKAVGVDSSRRMVEFAQVRAKAAGLKAQFRRMDITKLLKFPAASFDLVNGTFLHALLFPTQWSVLLQECRRVLRPGGIMRLTDVGTRVISSSESLSKLIDLYDEAMYRTGRSFSAPEQEIDICAVLGSFLRQAGFQQVEHRAFALDFSFGSQWHQAMYENVSRAFGPAGLQPFLAAADVATSSEIDDLYEQANGEMSSQTFYGLFSLVTVWGAQGEGNKPQSPVNKLKTIRSLYNDATSLRK